MLKTMIVKFQINVDLLEKLNKIQDAEELPFDDMIVRGLTEFAERRESQVASTTPAR